MSHRIDESHQNGRHGSPVLPRPAVRASLQSTKPTTSTSEKRKNKRRIRGLGKATDIVAIAILIAGGIGLYFTLEGNKDIKRQVETVAADPENEPDDDEDVASTAPPRVDEPSSDDIWSYQVAPDQPRFITIDSINVFARVKHIGRTQSGNIGAPTNIHDTSWFTSSTLPGEEKGSSVITGHVGRDRYNGVFYDLPKVKAGDEVAVTKGDGSVIKYVVESTETVAASKMRMGDYLSHAGQDKAKLHLITCVGAFDSELLSFTDRFIVTATKVD